MIPAPVSTARFGSKPDCLLLRSPFFVVEVDVAPGATTRFASKPVCLLLRSRVACLAQCIMCTAYILIVDGIGQCSSCCLDLLALFDRSMCASLRQLVEHRTIVRDYEIMISYETIGCWDGH